MLQHSGSLTDKVGSHLSCDDRSTDAILVNHRRSTHEPCIQQASHRLWASAGEFDPK